MKRTMFVVLLASLAATLFLVPSVAFAETAPQDEVRGFDTDGKGLPPGYDFWLRSSDTDGDGNPDKLHLDTDGDGVEDFGETVVRCRGTVTWIAGGMLTQGMVLRVICTEPWHEMRTDLFILDKNHDGDTSDDGEVTPY